MVILPFDDRSDAARALANALDAYRDTRPVVLAIPRGAVPMARHFADALGGELDIVLVKKIGAPANPEFAVGAVDEQGNIATNAGAAWSGATPAYIRAEAARQLAALRERAVRYRGPLAPIPLTGRVAIVVDDGLATGATMVAALKAVRQQGARRVVCAVPVASAEALSQVRALADETVCLATPRAFGAVGYYYLRAGGRRRGRVRARAQGRRAGATTRSSDDRRRHVDHARQRRVPRRRPGDSRGGAGPGGVRARQRQQSPQPSQPCGRRRAEPARPRHLVVRPADAAGERRAVGALRHRAAGAPARRRPVPGAA
jgi:predicted phosphoribosyltransferase